MVLLHAVYDLPVELDEKPNPITVGAYVELSLCDDAGTYRIKCVWHWPNWYTTLDGKRAELRETHEIPLRVCEVDALRKEKGLWDVQAFYRLWAQKLPHAITKGIQAATYAKVLSR